MDKKKLKILLCVLGFCLLCCAGAEFFKSGIHQEYHRSFFDVTSETKWDIRYVNFEVTLPLTIGAMVCFIIAACLKTDKKDSKKEIQSEKTNSASETTSEKLEKLKDLFDKQLISEEEYNKKKSEILDSNL